MILTVTLNPIIEHRLHYNDVKIGTANRGGKLSYYAGGKGINVSRQLNRIGVQNIAFTFLGGDHGRRLRAALTTEGINFTAVPTKSETRFGSVVIEETDRKVTHYFGQNSIILPREAEAFRQKLEKMMQNCEYVVFSGSSPSPESDGIFAYGLEVAGKYDKTAILDTYGESLKRAVGNQPTVLHLNKKEAAEYLQTPIETEEAAIKALAHFHNLGVKISILTDGDKPFFANHYGFVYKITPPVVSKSDETGSGDAMVAALVYGLYKDETILDSLKIAAAYGAANAMMTEVCEVNSKTAERLIPEVKIETIGKKLNLMNEMV
ncbi:MAG: PfkB family carbohydrate kinase [Ignavibacteriales bacterium]|nr:MAG: 1-phosphofructokinase [Ignavibacteriaceae bacterium]MBW7872474.1 1-phosphofructokinase [Ignavibacteria bacterium]MCZ2141973.1 PfkB family carbohydrate kinase [Ignavibacteriales bacterium]MBV6445139.1 Tagatose-6-phosphate kinase [Ignavibacteriaceae bacterium]MBZ0197596.1 1-phosphofructokinase [Ignavibacteriaceae bacterium]